MIYFSAITLAILPANVRDSFLVWLSNSRKVIVFDSNYRPKLWADATTARSCVETAWQLTSIGLPSLDDEMALFGDRSEEDIISRLSKWGVRNGALKRGSLGPRPIGAALGSNPVFEKAALVVDTTAAGDSFNGAFLASDLTDGDREKALTDGNNCALVVIAHRGAIIPMERA